MICSASVEAATWLTSRQAWMVVHRIENKGHKLRWKSKNVLNWGNISLTESRIRTNSWHLPHAVPHPVAGLDVICLTYNYIYERNIIYNRLYEKLHHDTDNIQLSVLEVCLSRTSRQKIQSKLESPSNILWMKQEWLVCLICNNGVLKNMKSLQKRTLIDGYNIPCISAASL